MITTVVFDADETLIALTPAVHGALVAVLDELRRLTPAAAALTMSDLESDWHAVFADLAAAPVTEIRRAALARSLARVGLTDELDRLAELFFARRFALSRPFPDALPALAALRTAYTIGLASNGNSHAERCGLGGQFAFEVYAHVNGVPKKPAPEFYAAVLAECGAKPSSVVYVGDSLTHDVVGAQAAGLRSIWLNRSGAICPDGIRPDAQVRSLTELPAVLQQLVAERAAS